MMHVYRRRRVTGGLGKIYNGVVKNAKMFAKSELGSNVLNATKKKILEAGSSAINKMLDGAPPAATIKTAVASLGAQLPGVAKKSLKRAVLGNGKKPIAKRKKLGGQMLYKLKQRRKSSAKLKKLQVLYKLRRLAVQRGPNFQRYRLSGKGRKNLAKARNRWGKPPAKKRKSPSLRIKRRTTRKRAPRRKKKKIRKRRTKSKKVKKPVSGRGRRKGRPSIRRKSSGRRRPRIKTIFDL